MDMDHPGSTMGIRSSIRTPLHDLIDLITECIGMIITGLGQKVLRSIAVIYFLGFEMS